MGGLPIPKPKRCCFCTRNLTVACVLICFWSMLASIHSIRILLCPVCGKQYTADDGPFHGLLMVVKWVLMGFNMVLICSSFAYLLGLFMGYRITADLFMFCGFATAVAMCVHGVINLLQLIASDCRNPSDILAHFIYVLLWIYFIIIVNSHRDEM